MKIQTKHIRILYGTVVFIIMAAIFLFSAQSGDSSGEASMSLTESFSQHFFAGKISENVIKILEQIIRKLAHFTEFAGLGFFVFAFAETFKKNTKATIILSLVFCCLYALSDEIHQYFVPERACRFTDVLIDTCGALFGILVFICIAKLTETIKNKKGNR